MFPRASSRVTEIGEIRPRLHLLVIESPAGPAMFRLLSTPATRGRVKPLICEPRDIMAVDDCWRANRVSEESNKRCN